MANSTELYSYQGQEPQPLPHKIRLSNGKSRTDVSTFTEEEIADAGFTGPYTKPEYNEETEKLVWSSETKQLTKENIPDKVFWKKLRNERNLKLLTSDWSQMPDVPLTSSQKTEWKTYRQALRDLPETIEDPRNIIWPQQPE